jgi:quercetin dioxygenase-like cupin family protein
MTTRRLAVFAAGVLIAAPSTAQAPALGSFAISWEQIQALPPSSNGRARQVVRQRTATLDELEIHVTALPPGATTHAPHTHPNEEVIVVREGTLEAFQNGKTTRVGPGGLLFMASNEPHNVVNVGETTAVYHVIAWHSPGMLKSSAAGPGNPAK